MNEQEYLDTYNGQSINELLELENKFEPYEIIYVLELALDNKKDSNKELSDSEMTVLAVQALNREVNNGGYQQFFYNSSVEYTPIISKSLKDIDCFKIADLTEKAIQCLGVKSMDFNAIEDRALSDDEEMESCFRELDNVFYESEEDIDGNTLKYVKENRQAFQIP